MNGESEGEYPFAFVVAFAAQSLVLLLLGFLSSLLLALVKAGDVVSEIFLVESDAQSFVLQSPLLQLRAFALFLHCLRFHPAIKQNLDYTTCHGSPTPSLFTASYYYYYYYYYYTRVLIYVCLYFYFIIVFFLLKLKYLFQFTLIYALECNNISEGKIHINHYIFYSLKGFFFNLYYYMH